MVAFLVACHALDDPPGYLTHRIIAGVVNGSLGHCGLCTSWLEIRCAVTVWACMVRDLPGQR